MDKTLERKRGRKKDGEKEREKSESPPGRQKKHKHGNQTNWNDGEAKRRECKSEIGCLTVSDVHFLHPRVDNNGRLVFSLAGRFPLHLSGLCTGHPLQVTRGEPLLTGCVCLSVAGEGCTLVLRVVLSILPVVPLQRVLIAGLLWCVWRRRGLHGLIAPHITTTVLGVVEIPPLVTKITVIFFTRRELRLSIFTAHHVGLHDWFIARLVGEY